MSLPLVRYVLTAAVRDRLLIALALVLIVGCSLSVFLASAAITEKNAFAVVFTGGGLRIAGALSLVLFVVSFVRRSFEAKDIEFLLSRPVGRIRLVLSYMLAFAILACVVAALEGLCVFILNPGHFGYGHFLWLASIMAESVIMVSAAFFFALVISSTAGAAIATFGLYVLARMMGQILGIMDSGQAAGVPFMKVLEAVMQIVSMVTPRLDLMGQSSWLLYGPEGATGFGFVLAQGAVFTALLVLAALIDFVRRQF